jgi:hypothetical protein
LYNILFASADRKPDKHRQDGEAALHDKAHLCLQHKRILLLPGHPRIDPDIPSMICLEKKSGRLFF